MEETTSEENDECVKATTCSVLSDIEDNLASDNNYLFVGDLSKECTEDDLKSLFSTQGEVKDIIIKRSKKTHKALGYGFVQMHSLEVAEQCLTKLQGLEIAGRHIRIGWGKPDCYLKISNLSFDTTLEMIHTAFAEFGSFKCSDTLIQQNGNALVV